MRNPPPKKSLGQHFLTDRNILGSIADAVAAEAGDTIVEVGPGRGSLTRVLAERVCRVVALELDVALVDVLRDTMPGNVEVHLADARSSDVEALLGGCVPYKMAGNLPYYAALPILRRFLESRCPPQRAVVLVQREVADLMCAPPGRLSLLSVGVQLFGAPRIVRVVRPGSFNPPPKVTSAVVAIDVYPEPAAGVRDTAAFFRVARAGFSAPRKQLRNSLASGLGEPALVVERLLADADVEPSRRPASLSIEEWASLTTAYA